MISDEDLLILECSKESFFKHIVKHPLALSCGHIVCKDCLPLNEYIIIKCSKCGEFNENNLNKSKESPAAKRLIILSLENLFVFIREKLENELNKLKEANFNGNIEEYFDKISQNIDKRVESLKKELDELRIDMIDKLNNIKKECKKTNSNKAKPFNEDYLNQIQNLVEESKLIENQTEKRFYELQDKLKELAVLTKDIDDTQTEISFQASDFQLDLSYIGEIINVTEARMIQSMNDEHTENNLNQVMSSIFYKDEIKDLNELCEFSPRSYWKLIYRASDHGFKSSDFHRKCDYNSNTLVIIETDENFIFGGFTSQMWTSNDGWKSDSNAFLFSFKNLFDTPFKFNANGNGKNAIYCHESFGPCFGHGDDITIKDKSNLHEKNETCFPSSYFAPSFKQNQCLLAGKRYFRVKDIEVFRISQYK
jgi:hypothetical protein